MASSGDDTNVAVPWHSQPFQTVLISTIVLPLGVPLVSPFLPLVRDTFALTDVHTSSLLSVYFLPGIVLSPGIGRVVDRAGRRPVLVFSLVTFGVVGTSIVFLTDFSVILAARFVQGVAAAGIFITTVTIIADSFGGMQQNVVFGLNVAALSTGRAVYTLLGGTLAQYGWKVPFLCYLVAILAGVFVVRTFEESARPGRTHHGVTLRRTIRELSAVRMPVLYGATILAELVAFGAIMTTLPFLLVAEYAISVVVVGAILTATTAASVVVAAGNGRLARRFSNHTLVATGFALYGLSLLGVVVAPSPTVVAILVLLFGAGIGLILPSVDAAISHAVSAEFRAGALSLRNSATGLGRAAGPLLFTGLAAVTGYRTLLLAAGIAMFVIGLCGLILVRR